MNITSLLSCRNCLQSDGIYHGFSVSDADFEEYQKKTEFEVMTQIERLRNQTAKRCEFCGSSNVEVHDVEVSNYPLYDFDRFAQRTKIDTAYIFLFMINIDKRGSNISLRQGGSPRLHTVFCKDAINTLIDTIKTRPDENFLPQIKGNFFICFSGSFDFFSDKASIRLERFRNTGLTRNEILNVLKPLALELGISIDVENEMKSNRVNPIYGKTFKGALFTEWLYSSEEEQSNGYPFAFITFNFDDATIIAFGYGDNIPPRVFITQLLDNTFIVDENQPPLYKDNMTVYFAKKI